MNMDPESIYIMANGGVLLLVLRQMLQTERRLGKGDTKLDTIQKKCPLFNGKKKPEPEEGVECLEE